MRSDDPPALGHSHPSLALSSDSRFTHALELNIRGREIPPLVDFGGLPPGTVESLIDEAVGNAIVFDARDGFIEDLHCATSPFANVQSDIQSTVHGRNTDAESSSSGSSAFTIVAAMLSIRSNSLAISITRASENWYPCMTSAARTYATRSCSFTVFACPTLRFFGRAG